MKNQFSKNTVICLYMLAIVKKHQIQFSEFNKMKGGACFDGRIRKYTFKCETPSPKKVRNTI